MGDYFYVCLYIGYSIGFLPIGVYLWKQNQLQQNVACIVPFLWLIVVATFYEGIVTSVFKINSSNWFTIYSILEMGCLLYFARRLLSKKYDALLIFFFLISFVVSTYFSFLDDKLHQTLTDDAYQQVVPTLIIYWIFFLWIKKSFLEMQIISFWNSGEFYFILSFLAYFSITLILYLMADTLYKYERSNFFDYWIFNVFAVIFQRLLLTIGIWKSYKKLN